MPHAPQSSAQEEAMFVDPISIAPPISTNTERCVVIHELAPTKAHQKESEDIPVVDNTTAEDIQAENFAPRENVA